MTQKVTPPVSQVVTQDLIAGFNEPVQSSQQVFRALLKAMSEPGTLIDLNHIESTPSSINKSCWQVALSLFDAETKIWLSPSLRRCASLISNLKFHCQSPLTDHPEAADFAICNADEIPLLNTLNWGCNEYPDQSTTLLIQVPAISTEPFWTLSGPGIETHRFLRVAGLPEYFRSELINSRQRFPQGIDTLYCCDQTLVALPRTTQITEEIR